MAWNVGGQFTGIQHGNTPSRKRTSLRRTNPRTYRTRSGSTTQTTAFSTFGNVDTSYLKVSADKYLQHAFELCCVKLNLSVLYYSDFYSLQQILHEGPSGR